eukprot:6179719-Pleurochrysis_carterae.AAC.2
MRTDHRAPAHASRDCRAPRQRPRPTRPCVNPSHRSKLLAHHSCRGKEKIVNIIHVCSVLEFYPATSSTGASLSSALMRALVLSLAFLLANGEVSSPSGTLVKRPFTRHTSLTFKSPLNGKPQSSDFEQAAVMRLRGGMTAKAGWGLLAAATVSELFSTVFMHYAKGFQKPLESVLAILFYAGSFVGFNLSLRALEISVAYAVWSAVVMAALAAGGMTFLGESKSLEKVAGILSIILGTVLLSLTQEA